MSTSRSHRLVDRHIERPSTFLGEVIVDRVGPADVNLAVVVDDHRVLGQGEADVVAEGPGSEPPGRPQSAGYRWFGTTGTPTVGGLPGRSATGHVGAPEVGLTSSVASQSWRVQPYGHRDRVGRVMGLDGSSRIRGAIVNTCGSRSLRGLLSGRFVGAFDEFAVLEWCAGTNECDQVRRVDGAPA